jgi:microcystin degradation protein MlrC
MELLLNCDLFYVSVSVSVSAGIVCAEAYSTISEAILCDIRAGCDAVLLDLHGAMIAANATDGEGELLSRIRAEFPTIPLAVALDLHANVTPKMAANCDVMMCLKTYPHIDMYDTGKHVGQLLKGLLTRVTRPTMSFCQVPLLSHTLCSNTNVGSMYAAVEAAKAIERLPHVLAASVAAGFSLADFHDAGMTVMVITDNDEALASSLAQQLKEVIWSNKEGFIYKSCPLSESLATARLLSTAPDTTTASSNSSSSSLSGPVLLLDHSDNVMSGGSCDTTDILEALLAHSFKRVAAGPFCDPDTVEQLGHMEVGSKATIHLGNKSGWLYNGGVSKPPLQLEGVLKAVVDGQFKVTGPIFTGQTADMGKCVLFEINNEIELIISSERIEPYDLQTYTIPGVVIAQKDFLLLKSRVYCRPMFGPLSKGLVECDSDQGGPTSSNYAYFDFKHVRKSVYPLYQNS